MSEYELYFTIFHLILGILSLFSIGIMIGHSFAPEPEQDALLQYETIYRESTPVQRLTVSTVLDEHSQLYNPEGYMDHIRKDMLYKLTDSLKPLVSFTEEVGFNHHHKVLRAEIKVVPFS